MRGSIKRRGVKIGDVQHAVFEGNQLQFTTNASLAFATYAVIILGQEYDVRVVALARDGRGPHGEQAPGRTRATAIVDERAEALAAG